VADLAIVVFRRKGRVAACAIGAVLFCLLVVPVGNTASSRARVTSVSRLNSQVVQEVNRVRAQHGLKPLARSSSLTRAAAAHSRSMATDGYFAHESSDGSVFWQRIKLFYSASGHSYWAVGENLVWSSPNLTAKQAVKMWMNSPPHRANLLSGTWREIGLSAVYSSDAPGDYQDQAATIVTADFGVRR
jgi:uncharacterized protein YkwD